MSHFFFPFFAQVTTYPMNFQQPGQYLASGWLPCFFTQVSGEMCLQFCDMVSYF